jgi:hypothetical protein
MKTLFETKGRKPEAVDRAVTAPHAIERVAGCPAAQANSRRGKSHA